MAIIKHLISTGGEQNKVEIATIIHKCYTLIVKQFPKAVKIYIIKIDSATYVVSPFYHKMGVDNKRCTHMTL